jgi:DNA replication protein DnaC
MEPTEETTSWKLEHNRRLAEEKTLLLRRMDLPRHVLAQMPAQSSTIAMDAVAQPFGILVLSGDPGCGKTFAAVKWIVDYVNDDSHWPQPGSAMQLRGRQPVFVTAAALARWDRYEQEPMAKLLRAPRLAIDDLGAEYLDKNGFYAALLDEVLNERYAARVPTLLTTNLPVDEFKARYGERIAGRIRETGTFVACGGVDLRRRVGI